MLGAYDTLYKTSNYFGKPYPELTEFFEKYERQGKVLDIGCGQGRDSIALARLGFTVTGVDNSIVGIEQLNKVAKVENLPLTGRQSDIFELDDFAQFDFVLLDNMFHFSKKDREKETELIIRIISKIKNGCLLIVCIQDSAKKVDILNSAIDHENRLERLTKIKFEYIFKDLKTGHKSKSNYQMVVVKK